MEVKNMGYTITALLIGVAIGYRIGLKSRRKINELKIKGLITRTSVIIGILGLMGSIFSSLMSLNTQEQQIVLILGLIAGILIGISRGVGGSTFLPRRTRSSISINLTD